MAGRDWDDAVYAAAKTAKMTVAQAREMTFAEVCSLAGVDSKKVPAAFFYESVRNRLAQRIEADEREARRGLLELEANTLLVDLRQQLEAEGLMLVVEDGKVKARPQAQGPTNALGVG